MTEEETDRLLHANLGRLEAIAAAGGAESAQDAGDC